jgi:uncharacterized protein
MQTSLVPQGEHGHLDLSRIAQDLQIRKVQVESVVQLLDEGNTIPFITRYRKERTGGLNEEVLRIIQERVGLLRQLAERKQTILKSIENQGKLTDELRAAILAADNPKRLEDLYLPYKPKKRTLATTAREKGLEPLALAVWNRDPAVNDLNAVLPTLVNPEKELNTPDDVLAGVQHILAELVAETADVRAVVRNVLWDTGKLCTTKSEKLAEGQGLDYKDYFQFTEPIRHIPPHRILAINRGEKENALSAKLEWDAETGHRAALERLPLSLEAPRPTEAATVTPAALPAEAPPAAPSETPAAPSIEPPPAATTAEASLAPVAVVEPAATPAPSADGSAAGPPTASPSPEPAPAPAPPAPHEGPERHGHGHHGHRGHGHGHGHHHGPHVSQRELAARRMEALAAHPHGEFIKKITADALARLLVPSLEREIRRELTHLAEGHAVSVFARNLRSKLLAAPLRGRRVLAIDPAFRTGCKLAALDEVGTPLEDAVIFPHPPQNKKAEARHKLEEFVRKHQINVIAIGNGTACRETEELVSDLIATLDARRSGKLPPEPPVLASPAAPPAVAEAPAPPAPAASEPAPVPAQAAPTEIAAAAPVPEPVAAQADSLALPPAPVAEGTPQPDVAPAPAPVAEGTSATPAPAPTPPPAPPQPAPLPSLAGLPDALPELAYVIVNEAGASVYSASPVGREEFPNFDATLRGTISIGRRLQDPLSELVKIDPQHVGVGLYQHDVSPKQLKESLEGVIESCVNTVGVDLNTASVPLLRHVSGLNQLVARDLIEYRKANGPFRSRDQLKQVPGIGEVRWVQAAGFLKIIGGDNPFDRTWIHPESYGLAQQVLADLGFGPDSLGDIQKVEELRGKLKGLSPEEVATRLGAGLPTVRDILDALARPGRDPREDLPPPIFKKGILKLEDLQPAMELKGTVLNVVDFGAFIDIGLKDSGLVHISQMANRYVKSPYDVVAVGDVVNVWVLSVDKERRRVSLTMIQPGTERKPPERKPAPPRERREGPPQGQRREGPPAGQRREGPPPGQRREGPPQGGQRREGPPHRGGGRRLPPRGQTAQGAPQHAGQHGGRGGHQPAAPQQQSGEAAAPTEQAAEGASKPAAARPQQGPPRKPRRQPPKPNLSQAALAGATPLGTFAELAAFWEAKKKEDEPEATPPTNGAEGAQTPPP